MVKQIFGAFRSECWTDGYGPHVRKDIESNRGYALSVSEREALRAELDGLFAERTVERPKVLFVYRVCGLGGVETSILNKIEALHREQRSRGSCS